VKWFGLYSLARLGVFGCTFLIVWLIAQFWLDWDAVTGLFIAIVALAISAPLSYFLLANLRNKAAVAIAAGADRARTAFERHRAAEDDPDPPSEG
jgi:hypothetical protein